MLVKTPYERNKSINQVLNLHRALCGPLEVIHCSTLFSSFFQMALWQILPSFTQSVWLRLGLSLVHVIRQSSNCVWGSQYNTVRIRCLTYWDVTMNQRFQVCTHLSSVLPATGCHSMLYRLLHAVITSACCRPAWTVSFSTLLDHFVFDDVLNMHFTGFPSVP